MSVQPWYQTCALRDDVRTGKLTLAEFAADLNDVRTGDAPVVYREPAMFFARTYPTYRMKQVARDVLLRLAGKGGKPVLQLRVAYGGGKTHMLIALLHLAERGAQFADHPTVREFATFAGLSELPKVRVALLPFDKFDTQEGLEVYAPDGKLRRVHTPWGALAYQLAGDAGFARVKGHEESFTPPAEPLLVDLLRAPLKEGLGTLVLVDEAVWYYRSLVNQNPRMLGTIKDFYQVLTQAVAKVDRAAMVAGLIASRVEANDQTGTQCLAALEDVFGRIAEPVEPVSREDVAEILRRRLFETVPGEAERRHVVDAVMAAMQKLPLRDAQRDQTAYDRIKDSYPFHPDLIDVLYGKWTQMDGFQRTRGALRLMAHALRDAEEHDTCPLVGPSALLPQNGGLSRALSQLVDICGAEKWTAILAGELGKAREIQTSLPTLKAREIEQAVVATFLHSQPTGQRAQPTELLALLAHPNVDVAVVDAGLRKWRELSWFLVEDPEVWQLGTTPNLTHMHAQAMLQVTEQDIIAELKTRIRNVPSLSAADAGVEVHRLPEHPHDVNDDLRLHFVILGPECAVELGKPLAKDVEAYFNEVTGPQNPRTYRNNIVALAPEVSRLAGLREQVRRWLGWQRLESPETKKLLTDRQQAELPRRKQEAANGLPEAVVAAYTVLVAVDEDGQVKAQGLRTVSGGTPFERIKAHLSDDERMLTTTLDPDLIMPGSDFEIWHEGESSRRLTDLMAAFGQFPRLPRLLRPEALFDTVVRGVRAGVLIVRLPRADGTVRTWWKIPPDIDTLRRTDVEVQPAQLGMLHNLDAELLRLESIADWSGLEKQPITLGEVESLFNGKVAPLLAQRQVLWEALRSAVRQGLVMAVWSGQAYFREMLPEGTLPDDLELHPAPAPLRAADLIPAALPGAWDNNETTPLRLFTALAEARAKPIPWSLLFQAVDEALRLGLFQHDPGQGPWPCSPVAAGDTVFRQVSEVPLSPDMVVAALEYVPSGTPTLQAVREAVEQIVGRRITEGHLLEAAQKAVEAGAVEVIDHVGPLGQARAPLSVRISRPKAALVAEAILSAVELERLGEQVAQLLSLAPDMAFTFRVVVTAEGQRPSAETLERLNKILGDIKQGLGLT